MLVSERFGFDGEFPGLCINLVFRYTERVSTLGVESFTAWLVRIGFQWPVVSGRWWSESHFDWHDAEALLRTHGISTLLRTHVGVDLRDSQRRVLIV